MVERSAPSPAGTKVAWLILLVTVLVVLSLASLVPEAPVRSAPADAGAPSLAPLASSTAVAVRGSLVANVNGYGSAPTLVGVNITAYGSSCSTTPPEPNTCPYVNSTTTNSSGDYELNLTSGEGYVIAAHPDPSVSSGAYPDGFGGASQTISLTGPKTVNLVVYPYVPYGNATFVLPRYNCLSQYLWQVGSAANKSNCQNPVLAWTQDGAFYVNLTDSLVFYSFPNRTATAISPWTPLYQTFPTYPMIPGEPMITQDGTYLYGWGTLSPSSTTVTFEAVNVTTGRWFMHNFTGLDTDNVALNGQVEMTGWDGNDSLVTLIESSGAIVDYNLWTKVQSAGPRLDFFEANNVYWEPYLNGYVNIQAGGSSMDRVEEWQLTGPGSTTLTRTFYGNWSANHLVNGVNGIALNVTGGTLDFGAGSSSGGNGVVMGVDGAGTITGVESVVSSPPGSNPFQFGPVAASDRPTLISSGPAFQGYYSGFFNDSFLADMTPGHFGFYSTNVSPYWWGGSPASYQWEQYAQEGAFFNTSYLIPPTSYACAGTDACSIQGRGGNTPGTVEWVWRLGQPEFPYPTTNPEAQATSPGPTDITAATTAANTIALSWVPPFADPLVSFTVAWGSTPDLGNFTSVGGGQTSYTIPGLLPGTRYFFSVEAWNLHYHGNSSGISSATTTDNVANSLQVTQLTSTEVTLAWTDPPSDEFTNLSVNFGTSSGSLITHQSVGTVAGVTLEGLTPHTTYFFEVVTWNGSIPAGSSGEVSGTTLGLPAAPTGLAAVAATASSIEWNWIQSGGGGVLNNTLFLFTGGSCTGTAVAFSTAGAATAETTAPLASATTYAADVTSWNSTGESPASTCTTATTANPALFTVTFTEEGLPDGAYWNVTVDSVTRSATASTITFLESNGTYAYQLGLVPGYHSTGTKSFEVSGSAKGVTVKFVATTYRVEFKESGLGSGTDWCVVFDGVEACHDGASISFTGTANGTYSYTVGRLANYSLEGAYSGSVTVDGGAQGSTSNIVDLPWKLVVYSVTFTETGLPAHTMWQVTFDGKLKSSTGTKIVFKVGNGTYGFVVDADGYTPSPPNGNLSIGGANLTQPVTFT